MKSATPPSDQRNNNSHRQSCRYPIFLTMLHMLSCAAYRYAAINLLQIVPFQQIHSKKQFLKIFALSAIFCFSVVCGNTSLRPWQIFFLPWQKFCSFSPKLSPVNTFSDSVRPCVVAVTARLTGRGCSGQRWMAASR
ncbi:hypothetical protein TSUD_213550 [Trifolium subterraneum]|uniref:Sugar phosphate transporter domain-containing protein n=1 Tax=Trifolium subterraneum TaxID=3900 RepID=A0A2Z6NJN1_TRISU|nr:hypothetical protein TSUD_213550 [Trifolium subterraneum]